MIRKQLMVVFLILLVPIVRILIYLQSELSIYFYNITKTNNEYNWTNHNTNTIHDSQHNTILNELIALTTITNNNSSSSTTDDCPFNLTFLENRIIRTQQQSEEEEQQRLIPQLIHVSMKSRCLPNDLVTSVNRWLQRFPNYSLLFHNDDAVQQLLQNPRWQTEFPLLQRAMQCVKYSGAMTIDIWRVLILYTYGGLYVDIDTWVEAFSEETIPSNASGFFFSDVWNRPSQWCMAFEPRHPLLYLAVNQITTNILNIPNVYRPRLVFTTGPQAVYQAYQQFTGGSRKHIQAPGWHKGLNTTKTILKLPHNTSMVDNGGHGYDNIVVYNGSKMTRRKKIEKETGVLHHRTERKNASNRIVVSCQQLLDNQSL